MSTITVRADIAEFAAAVRAHLDDLPSDDVDELADGLEADLSDQAEEAGDAFTIPDAAAYAAELRSAAGLPERTNTHRARRQVRERWVTTRDHVVSTIRDYRFGAWVLDTLVALRPVWWIARAAVLYLILVPLVGVPRPTANDMVDRALALQSDPVAALLFASLLLVSIQWGRDKWAPFAWLRVTRTVVSVIAVLALPMLLIAVTDARGVLTYAGSVSVVETHTPGLAVDGERVRNVFAYDGDGQPIERVQLFDQDGRPLTTVGGPAENEEWDFYFYGGGGPWPVADRVAGRDPVWNAFPLRELGPEGWANGEPDADDAAAPSFPFPQVPALVKAPTTEEAKADPSSSPTP